MWIFSWVQEHSVSLCQSQALVQVFGQGDGPNPKCVLQQTGEFLLASAGILRGIGAEPGFLVGKVGGGGCFLDLKFLTCMYLTDVEFLR